MANKKRSHGFAAVGGEWLGLGVTTIAMCLTSALAAETKQGQSLEGVEATENLDAAAPSGTSKGSKMGFDLSQDPLLSSGELLLFEKMPTVISAARHSQPINQLAVPVSIITAKDIHYSGQTSIPELLRQVPGMDVLRVDRNNYAFGVRGLHHGMSDRTLVLQDGRSTGTGILGGADFGRLPLFVGDIERIEVVRGPGGAAWGANAFNGVINIITKDPDSVPGFMVTSTLNDFGDTYSHLRWGHRVDDLAWRLSVGYEDFESSENAIMRDNFLSNDEARIWRFDGVGELDADMDNRLKFGLAGSQVNRGGQEFIGYPLPSDPPVEESIQTLRGFARWESDLGMDESFYLQWYGNFTQEDRPSLWNAWSLETDLEAQYNTRLDKDHELAIGGNVRMTHIRAQATSLRDLLPTDTADEYWLGAFVIHRWNLTDQLTFETQARVDWYSETQMDWSGRVSALYGLDEQKNHVLRASAAKAFRSPLYAIRQVQGARLELPTPPFPPSSFAITLLPAENMENEQIWSFESGYRGQLTDEWSVAVDGYYQIYHDLIGGIQVASMPGTSTSRIANIDGARAFGGEAQLAWEIESLKLGLWYAFNDVQDEVEGQNMRSYRPAKHKVGFNGRWSITQDLVANLTYRYTGLTLNDGLGTSSVVPSVPVEENHVLDLTFTARIPKSGLEITVGVLDVLDESKMAKQQIGSVTAHPTPGRTAFIRATFNF